MKYRSEITIELPRDQVLEILYNPDNMKHWQQGLLSYRPLSGEPGAEGGQVELQYKMGRRHIVMVETILKRSLPEEMHATYDTKGVHNLQKNYFEELGEGKTRWISENEFQFEAFSMKIVGWLMPGAFKKQTKAYMSDFKVFAETGKSALDKTTD